MEIVSDQSQAIEMPMIFGYNSNEGIVGLPDCHEKNKYELFDKDLARYIPKTIDLVMDDPKCEAIADNIRQFYFSGRKVSDESKFELSKLIGDYHFNMELQFLAETYARRQHK